MEENWEPRYESLDLGPHRITRLMRGFAGSRPFIVRDALPGGLANVNVRVSLDDPAQEVVLRVFVRDPTVAEKEAALLALLEGTIPVPHLLHQGAVFDAPGEAPLVVHVTSWVPGIALTDLLRDGDERAQQVAGGQIGRALATLHAHGYTRMGFLDASLDVAKPFGSLRATVTDFMTAAVPDGHAGRRLGRETSKRLLRFVETHAPRLASIEDRYALLHADCKPTNVRVSPDGNLTGLMDWEFAWAGPPLFDLGQMFRWPTPRAFEEALARAYAEAGGRLPEDWRSLARLLDLLNLVGFLDDEVERPVTMRDVTSLIEATLSAP